VSPGEKSQFPAIPSDFETWRKTISMSADGQTIVWGYQRFSDELYLVEGLK
jgi:hypothetical protein